MSRESGERDESQSGQMDGLAPLPWQQELLARIGGQLAAGRLHHAWLLQGRQGIGKEQFARALAAARLCQARGTDGTACGRCRSCTWLRAGSHPDLLRIEPEKPGGALKIDAIRRISDFVQQTAGSGSARVVILAPAESLGPGAANALLKSLEEPPGDSLFLLVTHVSGGVLPTIRSRCQPLQLPLPDEGETRQWLQRNGQSDGDIDAALDLAARQPLRALQLLEAGIPGLYRDMEKQSTDWLATDGDPGELVRISQNHDARQVLAWFLRDLNRRATTAARSGHSNADAPLFPAWRELLRIDAQLAGSANPNRQLSLETAFIHWKRAAGRCRP